MRTGKKQEEQFIWSEDLLFYKKRSKWTVWQLKPACWTTSKLHSMHAWVSMWWKKLSGVKTILGSHPVTQIFNLFLIHRQSETLFRHTFSISHLVSISSPLSVFKDQCNILFLVSCFLASPYKHVAVYSSLHYPGRLNSKQDKLNWIAIP